MDGTSRIDEAKLNELLGKVVGDLGAAMSAPLMVIGDRLGGSTRRWPRAAPRLRRSWRRAPERRSGTSAPGW